MNLTQALKMTHHHLEHCYHARTSTLLSRPRASRFPPVAAVENIFEGTFTK